jgi:hypothetical protein
VQVVHPSNDSEGFAKHQATVRNTITGKPEAKRVSETGNPV